MSSLALYSVLSFVERFGILDSPSHSFLCEYLVRVQPPRRIWSALTAQEATRVLRPRMFCTEHSNSINHRDELSDPCCSSQQDNAQHNLSTYY
jgi:hypothetical protein